jgi:MFS family permease
MSELTNFQKLKALPWQFAGHVLTTVFIRTDFYGGAMFMLFLSELKLDKSRIGFLMSLLTAFGFLGLFCAPLTARVGFKRSYMSFVIGRLIFVAPLLLLPYVVNQYGTQYGFWLLVAAMSCFALIKTFGEVAWVPWAQEVVPDSVRGKFNAVVNVGTMLSSILITGLGGYLIGRITGLTPYMIMIYIGLAAGIVSIWCYAKMPGGSPVKVECKKNAHFKEMLESITKDRNYLHYNLAIAVVFIGFNIAATFVSLFLKEEVGLPSNVVVWLDIANFGGSMLSCYFWGWASDRYGSKPVMLIGPILLLVFPLLCIFMPHHHILSAPFGLLVMSIIGIGGMAWILGINRYLYVTAMPEEKRTGYSAVYYVNQTLAICIGPLVSGFLIDKMSSMRAWLGQYSIEPYTPIFILGFLGMLCGIIIMGKVRSSGDMPLFSFIRLFIRTDTAKSIFLIAGFRFAITEKQRALLAFRLGRIKNPLIQKELELLKKDPSFEVRIATAAPEAKLISVQLTEVFESARLRETKIFPVIIKLMAETADPVEATDLMYSAAKVLGSEDQFYGKWKKLQNDSGTGAADMFWNLRGEMKKLKMDISIVALAEEVAGKFAKNEYIPANALVAQLISRLFANDNYATGIIQACRSRLEQSLLIDSSCLALAHCLIKRKLSGQVETIGCQTAIKNESMPV